MKRPGIAPLLGLGLACSSAVSNTPVSTPVVPQQTTPATTLAPPPPCRLAVDVAPAVGITAKWALQAVAGLADPLADRVVVNRQSHGALPIYVVRDAAQGSTDAAGCLGTALAASASSTLDSISIQGVCVATARDVRCSEQALNVLIGTEERNGPSAGLLFLLAHEFAHRALGHVNAHADNVVPLDSPSANRRLEALQRGCARDHIVLAQESAADELALRAFVSALAGPGFAPSPAWARKSVPQGAEQAYQAIGRLVRWSYATPGQRPAHSTTGHHVCEVMRADAPPQETLPFYGGGHPRRWTRLAAIMKAAVDSVGYDDSGKERDDQRRLFGAALMDQLQAQVAERQVRDFCRDVSAFEAETLDCTTFVARSIYEVPSDLVASLPKPPPDLSVPGLEPSTTSITRGSAGRYFLGWSLEAAETFRSTEAAKNGQRALVAHIRAHLGVLADGCERTGCVVVHQQLSPVQVTAQGFTGQSSVKFQGSIFLRAAADTIVPLPSSQARTKVQRAAWNDARIQVRLDFRVERTPNHKYSVITKPLVLGEIFDLAAAAAGRPSALAVPLRDIARFSRERLTREFGPVLPDNEPARPVVGLGFAVDAPGWDYAIRGHGSSATSDGAETLLALPRPNQPKTSFRLVFSELETELPPAWDAEIDSAQERKLPDRELVPKIGSLHRSAESPPLAEDALRRVLALDPRSHR